jgi:hypothetical protein
MLARPICSRILPPFIESTKAHGRVVFVHICALAGHTGPIFGRVRREVYNHDRATIAARKVAVQTDGHYETRSCVFRGRFDVIALEGCGWWFRCALSTANG